MQKSHYGTLDAMRGLAAIAVALFHVHDSLPFAPASAYLAVDLFFAMSGFVIAHAYDRRLADGMGVASFMRLRFARLYPLFALGTLLALLKGAAGIYVGLPDALPSWHVGLSGLLGLLWLPTAIMGAPMFLNIPAWSLFFEIVANATFAAFHRFLSIRVLSGVVAVCFAGLVWMAMRGTLDLGYRWPEMVEGLVRVGFSFPLGVLIYRLRLRVPAVHPALVLGVLVVALFAPWRSAGYDLLVVAVISPALVIFGANCRTTWGANFLGEMSYPLYTLHFPLLAVGSFVATKMHAPQVVGYLVVIVAVIAATPLISRLYDLPMRRFLAWLVRDRKAAITGAL